MVSCQRVICGALYLKFQVLCRKSDVPADCEMRKGLLAITVVGFHRPNLYIKHHLQNHFQSFNIMSMKIIREYGSTLYIGLSRLPHRANTNRFRCNSLASEHFRPKF